MKIKKLLILIFSLFTFLIIHSQNEGLLDENFGDHGIVITDFLFNYNTCETIAIHEDGRIILGGTSIIDEQSDFLFAQYLEDGSPDISFGSNGILSIFKENSNDHIKDIVIQNDGKIVAAGYWGNDEERDFALTRINPDGTVDNTFSNNGFASISFNDNDFGYKLKLQEDNKIVIVGLTRNAEANEDFDLALCRLNNDGSLDTDFGNNGKIIYDINEGSQDFIDGLAIYENNIYVSGLTFNASKDQNGLVVLKYSEAGNPDLSFGNDGIAFFDLEINSSVWYAETDITVNEIAIYIATHQETEADGKDFAIVSLLHNGIANEDFGNQGLVITNMIGYNTANCIAIQTDNKILAAGIHTDFVNADDFCIVRYHENGNIDDEFGNEGIVITNVSTNNDLPVDGIYSMALQDDNKIIVAGFCNTVSGEIDFAMARYYSGLEVDICEFFKEHKHIFIFPNPATDYFEVNFDESMFIEIYDTHSQLKLITNKRKIDTKNFSSGIYIVIFKNQDFKIIGSEKVLIK